VHTWPEPLVPGRRPGAEPQRGEPRPGPQAATAPARLRFIQAIRGEAAATGVIELLLAVFTGSAGLLGDAIRNLSDVSASAVVFLGFWLCRRPPTDRYPYGLDRAEDLAGIGMAAVIWVSAAFAGTESIRKMPGHGHATAVGAGIAGAVIGIAGRQPHLDQPRRAG
jgi:hypothetical protein